MKNLKQVILSQKLKEIISIQILLAVWPTMLFPGRPRGQILFSAILGTLLALGELKKASMKNKRG